MARVCEGVGYGGGTHGVDVVNAGHEDKVWRVLLCDVSIHERPGLQLMPVTWREGERGERGKERDREKVREREGGGERKEGREWILKRTSLHFLSHKGPVYRGRGS